MHTDCISEEMLVKYIAGNLSSAEKHGVEKHLIDCEMCADAVEGLKMLSDPNQLSSITVELNQKIKNKAGQKKEVKVVFLRQYRTQFAVAASIVLVLGLVWFFRSNMMKEMSPSSAEKIFADKFEPPPSDLSIKTTEESTTDGKNSGPGTNNLPVTAQEPVANIHLDIQDAKATMKTGKDLSTGENFARDENGVAVSEEIPLQKSAQVQYKVPVEEKAEEDFRSKNAEVTTKGNANTTVADEKTKGNGAVLLSKEVSKKELETLKEKDKKDESQKPQAVPSMSATGVSAGAGDKQVTGNTGGLTKPDANKVTVDREDKEEKANHWAETPKGDLLAFESKKKSGGKENKKGKETAPQKVTEGDYETQTITSTPVPKSQTEVMQNEQSVLDSVSVLSAITPDASNLSGGAMNKYDKQDYAGAIIDFEQALKINPNDEKALFYSAVSYLSLGQTDKAVTYLNKVLQNKGGAYYDSAQWYLSLAYIKNNDTKNARMNLMELQNNSKSKYQKQADQTLKEINK